MIDTEHLETLVRAVVDKVLHEMPRPQIVPATVVTAETAQGDAVVHIDGDPAGTTTHAETLVTSALRANQRVMVQFQPPRACFIVGAVRSAYGPVVRTGTGADSDFAVTPPDGAMVASTTPRLWVRVAGTWRYAALT